MGREGNRCAHAAPQGLYPCEDDELLAAAPDGHPILSQTRVNPEDLAPRDLILLEDGHCLRDQVLQVCPELMRFSSSSAEGIQKTFEGSSLETIRHMVASGIGLTVLPASAVPAKPRKGDHSPPV